MRRAVVRTPRRRHDRIRTRGRSVAYGTFVFNRIFLFESPQAGDETFCLVRGAEVEPGRPAAAVLDVEFNVLQRKPPRTPHATHIDYSRKPSPMTQSQYPDEKQKERDEL